MKIHSGCPCAPGFDDRWIAFQLMVAAMMVVEILEAVEFPLYLARIPEGHSVEIFSPDRADESFYERKRS